MYSIDTGLCRSSERRFIDRIEPVVGDEEMTSVPAPSHQVDLESLRVERDTHMLVAETGMFSWWVSG